MPLIVQKNITILKSLENNTVFKKTVTDTWIKSGLELERPTFSTMLQAILENDETKSLLQKETQDSYLKQVQESINADQATARIWIISYVLTYSGNISDILSLDIGQVPSDFTASKKSEVESVISDNEIVFHEVDDLQETSHTASITNIPNTKNRIITLNSRDRSFSKEDFEKDIDLRQIGEYLMSKYTMFVYFTLNSESYPHVDIVSLEYEQEVYRHIPQWTQDIFVNRKRDENRVIAILEDISIKMNGTPIVSIDENVFNWIDIPQYLLQIEKNIVETIALYITNNEGHVDEKLKAYISYFFSWE